MPVIEVSAAIVEDADGRLLLVRKRGTDRFMQAGGKAEPGESPAQALVRELHEELGLVVDLGALEPFGTFTAAAANEAGHTVLAHVFRLPPLPGADAAALSPGAEIDELVWFEPGRDDGAYLLAPLFETVVLPLVVGGRA